MRIVVALDVDEVLNANGNGGEKHRIVISKDEVPKSPFVRGYGNEDLSLTITVNPEHGEWINSLLSRGIEVVWATTWENAANVHLAPLLGIPALPVGTSVTEHPPRFGHASNGDSGAWKAEALQEKYDGDDVALVWVDDSAFGYDEDSTVSDRDVLLASGVPEAEWEGFLPLDRNPLLKDGPSLVITPPVDYNDLDTAQGLTQKHIAQIEAWIAKGPVLHPDCEDDEGEFLSRFRVPDSD